nr:hypothetical protein [Nostoc sp. EkiNYC01]
MAIESQMFLCRLSSSPDSEGVHETTANTATEPTLPTTPALPRARAEFSLSVEEMGEKLVSNVMNFTTDPAFTQKISIKGLGEIDWPNLAKSICPPPEDYDLLGVIYSKTEGIGGNVELRACRSRFELPDFSQTIEEPPLTKCLKNLDELINDPPTNPVPY